MENLIRQQADTIRSVSRTLSNFKKIGKGNYTIAKVSNRLSHLKDTWADCKNQHAKIQNLADETTKSTMAYFTEDTFLGAEDAFIEATDFMMECLSDLESKASTSNVQNINQQVSGPQQSGSTIGSLLELPAIALPNFSGDYRDWESFRDRFTALVIDNNSLSNVRRMYYLQSCLTDAALNSIKTLPATDANFSIAWDILKSNFENKHRLINSHLQTFFDMPNVNAGSSKSLKLLRDTSKIVFQSLKNLGCKVEHWDDVYVFTMSRKLDKNTRQAWEIKLGDSVECPSYEKLDQFLRSRIIALEAMVPENTTASIAEKSDPRHSNSRAVYTHNGTHAPFDKCSICNGNHFVLNCTLYKNKTPSQRFAIIKQEKRCINCLSMSHRTKECRNASTCRKCRKRHHTTLHFDESAFSTDRQLDSNLTESDTVPRNTIENINSHFSNNENNKKSKILLATAWIQVCSESGRRQKIRALLDQGSEATFISESVAQSLRATRTRVDVSVSGIGGTQAGLSRFAAQIIIEPCEQEGPSYTTNALILKSLTQYIPHRTADASQWRHIKGLKLADPDIHNSSPIQAIIGADLYGFILLAGVRKGSAGQPIAQNTIFGWILSGPTSLSSPEKMSSIRAHHVHENISLDIAIRKFWEIEELPKKSLLTPDEQQCEDHFRISHSRHCDGRYIVRLPFKQGPPIDIGASEHRARAMLLRSEPRFHYKIEVNSEYRKFLEEYEHLGHMTLSSANENASSQIVYIPHHAVIRESSLTTKLRVVFNASSVTTNGSSLNDHLMIGPKLQLDLPSIILQWRQYKFVYCADIEKMYRQILIDDRDINYQRILWRPTSDAEIKAYTLRTVTYGTAPAPYLALRVLQQLAEDEGAQFPLAVPIVRQNTFMDDCLFGSDNEHTARAMRDQLVELLSKGGFSLRKWASNQKALLNDIKEENHGHALSKSFSEDDNLKILGIVWHPAIDFFQFRVSALSPIPTTKRQILSAISKLFDPLGWVTPVVIQAKIMMQRLWLHKCDWDECIPTEIFKDWEQYCIQLPLLNGISMKRWTQQGDQVLSCELHGFSDASNAAYAAVAYLRLKLNSGRVITSLLAAKSKVAPIKQLSIPRLELSAAALLAKLISFIQTAMNLAHVPCTCWSDSTIVLEWVKHHPVRWNTFVANRVALIQTLVPTSRWRHVPTSQNPADCASRGMDVKKLAQHELWWDGPDWLTSSPESWPSSPVFETDDRDLEAKTQISVHTANQLPCWDLVSRFSNWAKLLRVTAYIWRFSNRCRRFQANGSNQVLTKALNPDEIQRAKVFWLKQIQLDLFPNDVKCLASGLPLDKKSSLLSLNAFMDTDGLIRVGGRLENSSQEFQSKHPVILKSHALVTLIIRGLHERALHSGAQLTLNMLRDEYWIVRARQVVRSVISNCVVCTREKALIPNQLMGNLPAVRVTPTVRAFVHCGIDYAGPFLIRSTPGRGRKSHKTYIALFVCMTTRAIHLELVNGYDTQSFLAAFNRFCSRRGLPSSMYSDNAKNFRGADRELASMFKTVTNDATMLNYLASDNIMWHFIPPSAPHFGGLWEAGVRCVKYHLKRIVGTQTLTVEEFTTLLAQTEACLNSRPLAPLSDCLDDYQALTPGHFLIGSAITTVPSPTMLDCNENRLTRWQLVRQMFESFWKRWSNEYMQTLQQRSKWLFKKDEVKPGTIVLLRNSLVPPCKWDLGRVLECHKGADNLTRVVTVKTATSECKRPIVKLCLLPIKIDEASLQSITKTSDNQQ